MRIITGDLRGRKIEFPKLKTVRPTRDMVRKAIFDVLGDFPRDKSVLDLFSASGAFGLEALSNGAAAAVFVDHDFSCVRVIRENIERLGVGGKCHVITRDVFGELAEFAGRKESFQLIFADPPYAGELAKKCLLELSKYDILHPPAIVVIEHYKKDELPSACGALMLWQQKRYGDTVVSFYVPG